MILFPNDSLDRSEVDRDYQIEFEAARAAGFEVALFDFDGLRRGEPLERVLRRVPEASGARNLIYRGWMLSAPDYARLMHGLRERGWAPINDETAYRFGHHAPENYEFWSNWMPQTVWVEREEFEKADKFEFEPIFEALKPFCGAPVIVKDWVKSQKHRWEEACFIPDSSSAKQVRRVVGRFLELQGDYLTGGLIFRRFEKLRHDAAGHPFEWRSFWFDSKLLSLSPNPVGDEVPNMEAVSGLARRCPSRFFTLDFAQRENGKWIIIEMGDGGVSGLPPGVDASEWYRSLKRLYDDAVPDDSP